MDLSAILQGVGVLPRRLEALEREASEPKPPPQSMDLVALTQLEQRMTNMEVGGGETHKMVLGVHRELQKHAAYLTEMGGAMTHLGKQTESVSSKMQSMRDEVQKAFREVTQRMEMMAKAQARGGVRVPPSVPKVPNTGRGGCKVANLPIHDANSVLVYAKSIIKSGHSA